jgi:NAD(P)-dependent dehydrogenase (short-subunit alcohol dehydrogenase family)
MRSLNTDLFGPVNLSRAILPHFRAKKSGFLVFIGSKAGWKGDPGAAAYCASKFAQEGRRIESILYFATGKLIRDDSVSIVECLQQEMPIFGVKTIIFEPGYFRTQALSQKNLKHEPSTIPAYADFNKMSI